MDNTNGEENDDGHETMSGEAEVVHAEEDNEPSVCDQAPARLTKTTRSHAFAVLTKTRTIEEQRRKESKACRKHETKHEASVSRLPSQLVGQRQNEQ